MLPGAFLAAVAGGNRAGDRAGDRKGAIHLLNGFGLGVVLANVPWMIASFSGWMAVWKFHADRFPDLGTVWYWLAQAGNAYVHPSPWWNAVSGGWGGFVGTAGLGAFGLVSLPLTQTYNSIVDRQRFRVGTGIIWILRHNAR